MKVAVLSDIHSNYFMLEKIIKKLLNEGIEHFIFAGDMITDGYQDNEVINLIKWLKESGLSTYVVAGNRERYISLYEEGKLQHLKDTKSVDTTYRNIVNGNNYDYIKSLPDQLSFKIDDISFLVDHHNPLGSKQSIWPEDYILRQSISTSLSNDVFITGHTHSAFSDKINGKYFVNPGSFGVSNGLPMAIDYMVMHICTSKRIDIEHRMQSYDLADYVKEFIKSEYYDINPEWSLLNFNSRAAGYSYFTDFIEFTNRNPHLSYEEAFKIYFKETSLCNSEEFLNRTFYEKIRKTNVS